MYERYITNSCENTERGDKMDIKKEEGQEMEKVMERQSNESYPNQDSHNNEEKIDQYEKAWKELSSDSIKQLSKLVSGHIEEE